MRTLILLAVVCVGCVSAIEVTPASMSDSYGNRADADSKLVFVALPAGEEYKVSPEAYTYGGLKPLFDGIHGFVNICFGAEDPFGKYFVQ